MYSGDSDLKEKPYDCKEKCQSDPFHDGVNDITHTN